ncbi:MAG: hypothetical protein QM499_06745, partial [Flavobacteriaceae bacterium]
MKKLLFLLFIVLISCHSEPEKDSVLIEGATLINPSDKTEVIESSYVYLLGNVIVSYGDLKDKPSYLIAEKTINAEDKFIMPGIIDGFATLNNQAYANAYLYKGITSIIEVDGYRRGPFYPDANPSPQIYRLEGVGEEPATNEELIKRIDSLYDANFRVLLMMYS